MDSPSTSRHPSEAGHPSSTTQKVVNDDENIIYAFKRYVHVKKDRKRQTAVNYELNEVDNRDVRGNEQLYAVSKEIREAAERDRNRRRTRGTGVTYSDPLVTKIIDESTTNRPRKEENYRSRNPQKGIYDHPFYRDHQKRSQSETNVHSSRSKERTESGKERRKSLRPASTKGHNLTELPTATLAGQSLTKYNKTKKSAKGERSSSKKSGNDDTGFMLIGGAYANSL